MWYGDTIKSFRGVETAAVSDREFSRRLPGDTQALALRRLRMIASAVDVNDLRSQPAKRLEKLRGDRERRYSVRINDQLRICYAGRGGGACDVEICDYD